MHPIEFVQQRRAAKRRAPPRPLVRSGQVSHAPLAEAPPAAAEGPETKSKWPYIIGGLALGGALILIFDKAVGSKMTTAARKV